MMKRMITALTFSLCAASVFAAGTVKVITSGSAEPKTLTGAEHLIDLVGQPTLANSWWPAAVIGEELATVTAQRQQQALLGRLAALSAEEGGDDAAAINTLRQQIQTLKVTGRQRVNLDPDAVRVSERGIRRCRATTRCGLGLSQRKSPCLARSIIRVNSRLCQGVISPAISPDKVC